MRLVQLLPQPQGFLPQGPSAEGPARAARGTQPQLQKDPYTLVVQYSGIPVLPLVWDPTLVLLVGVASGFISTLK